MRETLIRHGPEGGGENSVAVADGGPTSYFMASLLKLHFFLNLFFPPCTTRKRFVFTVSRPRACCGSLSAPSTRRRSVGAAAFENLAKLKRCRSDAEGELRRGGIKDEEDLE